MPRGFFKPLELAPSTKIAVPTVAQCNACGLYRNCRSPKMAVDGEGRRKVLVVGEAPGSTEDEQGKPFVGSSGQLLSETFTRLGFNLRRDCWITNSVWCHPERNDLPPRAVEYCRPNLIDAIKRLQPEVVLLFGGSAVESLIGWLWKENVGAVGRWTGWQIPSQRLNAWVHPTWHPSYLLREGNDESVTRLWFRRHVEAALKKTGRPWKTVPDLGSKVRQTQDPDEAAAWLGKLGDGPVAYDFETDRLKPDHPDAKILCCAVSDGKRTLAYPWAGAAVEATWKLLASDVPKIGTNMKFEDRWTRRFGKYVRGWWWDTMLAAHVLDNRPGITSVKFQAFVLLGAESWDDEVKSFKEGGQSANSPNRLRDVPWGKMLHYCGLDALLEWKVAMKQRRLMGL